MKNIRQIIERNSELFATCIYIALVIGITQVVSGAVQKNVIDNPDYFSKGIWFFLVVMLYGLVFFGLVKISKRFRNFILRMFGAESEKKDTPNTATQNEVNAKGKRHSTNWEKYAVAISIIGLLLSISLTIQSFQLTEQSNSIAQRSLDLQNNLSNFTSNIVPNTDRIYLDGDGWYLNGTTPPIHSFGSFNFSLLIFTPYYGTAKVTVENFTMVDYGGVLEPNKTLFFDNSSYLYNNHEKAVVSGLTKLDFSIPLSVYTYPNLERIRQFPISINAPHYLNIGVLYLNATFSNTEGVLITTKAFSEMVLVGIRIAT